MWWKDCDFNMTNERKPHLKLPSLFWYLKELAFKEHGLNEFDILVLHIGAWPCRNLIKKLQL
jgi:hypothetical protein